MRKSKALVAAEQRIAALEARLEVAAQVYRDQRQKIAALEAQLNARGRGAAVPVITTYTDRAGQVWEKTRVGSRTTYRAIETGACQ